jgi:hypothetical protein
MVNDATLRTLSVVGAHIAPALSQYHQFCESPASPAWRATMASRHLTPACFTDSSVTANQGIAAKPSQGSPGVWYARSSDPGS